MRKKVFTGRECSAAVSTGARKKALDTALVLLDGGKPVLEGVHVATKWPVCPRKTIGVGTLSTTHLERTSQWAVSPRFFRDRRSW